MKKKLLALLLAVMMILGSTAMAEELTSILGWGIGGDTQGPLTGWVGELWAKKGLQLEAVGNGNSEEKMQVMLASGDIPDVIRFASWVDFETAIDAGYLLNLDEHIDKLPFSVANMGEALQYTRDYHSNGTGNLYGLVDNVGVYDGGTSVGCYAFNVRWDIYAKAGYPKAEKLEDMIDVFKAMKEVYPKTEEGLETYAINLFAAWDGGSRFSFANAVLTTLGYWEGGQSYFITYHIPSGEVDSIFDDDSTFKRAVHFLYELNQAGLVDPDALTQEYTTSQSKIGNGQYMACWWGGYSSAFDTLEKANMDEPQGFMPVIFDEFISATPGNMPMGSGWPICISAKAADKGEDYLNACLTLLDANADPDFLYELYNGPKGLFWDVDENGKTYATEAGYEKADKGTYTLESGEEYQYFNGRYNLTSPYLVQAGLVDDGYGEEMKLYSNSNKLQKAWSEFYGGEYNFPIDKIKAENRLALRPVSLTTFLPSLSDDQKMIQSAVGAVVQQKGWQMVYAADEAEFESLWQQMKNDCLALGAEEIQNWFNEQLPAAKEAAAKYGEQ